MLRWFNRSVMGLAVLAMLSTVVLAQDEGGRRRGGQQGGRGGQQGGRGQQGRGGFGGGRGGAGGGNVRLMLLGVKEVQEEIDLLPDQEDDIKKAGEEMQAKARENRPDFSNFREMSEEERNKLMTKMREQGAKMAKEMDEKLNDILLPPQSDRLDEIALQVQGAAALLTDKVGKALKITAAQKKKIEEAQEESRNGMREKMREIFQGGNREGMREAIAKMREEMSASLMKPLSSDQKKEFEKMKGEPFKMPENFRGAGGFGGGGGRGGFGGGRGGQGGRGGRGGQGGGGRPQRPGRPGADDPTL